MKKTYINPEMVVVPLMAKQTIAVVSVTTLGGDVDDLDLGDGEIPTTADVKGFGNINVWDNEW